MYTIGNYFIQNLNILGAEYEKIIFILSWLGIIMMIYVYYSWYSLTKQVVSPYIIFMLFFFLFNYGQCILWAFNIHMKDEIGTIPLWYVHFVPSDFDIIKTQLFTLICISSFHLGAMSCYKPKKMFEKNFLMLDSIYSSMFIIGTLLGFITIPITFYRNITFFIVSATSGYASLYSGEVNAGGIGMIADMFFFPSLVSILIGSKYQKKIMYFVYFIFATYMLLNLFSGSRGTWLYKLAILMWLHHNFVKKFSFKKIMSIGFFGLIGLSLLAVLTSFRNIGISSIQFSDFIEALRADNSVIAESIFEMGGSMSIITSLLRDGSQIWPYGNTFFMTLLGVVSTRFLSIFDIPFVLIENWFSFSYLGISWGAGFSLIGEAFLNGGLYFSPLLLCFVGYLIGSTLYLDKKIIPLKYPLRFFFVASSLQSLIGLSRGSSYLFFKEWFYGTLLFAVLILIFAKFSIKYKKIKRR